MIPAEKIPKLVENHSLASAQNKCECLVCNLQRERAGRLQGQPIDWRRRHQKPLVVLVVAFSGGRAESASCKPATLQACKAHAGRQTLADGTPKSSPGEEATNANEMVGSEVGHIKFAILMLILFAYT